MKNTLLNMKKMAIISGLSLGAFALSALAATSWTPATQNPPGGNTDAPINVGPSPQFKAGPLAVGSLVVGKNSVPATGFDLDVDGFGLFTGLSVSGSGYFSADGTFLGKVGIGTNAPTKKLEVVGGPIKATGGLIIETVATDPINPESGRMWLVTP